MSLVGFVTTLLARVLPNATNYLRDNQEYSATLFFGMALIPLGLLVASRENALETFLFRPLRSLLLLNTILHFLNGVFYAGNLREPFFTPAANTLLISYFALNVLILKPRLVEIVARITRRQPKS